MITIVHQQPLHAIQPVSLTFTHPLRESSTQRSRRSENSAPSWYIVSRRPSHWRNIQKMKTSIINGSEVSRLSVAIQSVVTVTDERTTSGPELISYQWNHFVVTHRSPWALEDYWIKYYPFSRPEHVAK
ncbi:hypothetical protein ACWYZY_003395 [Enterobacter kobei]